MTGSRTGAADLTTRITKTDIRDIIDAINTGTAITVIYRAYHMSYSSLVRILQPWNWTNAQRHHWGYDTLPEIIWPEGTKRPKGTYPPGDPIPETTASKKVVFRQKNTEYESGSKDAKAYLDAENSNEPKRTVQIPNKVTLEPDDKISVIVEKALGNDLDLHDNLPELEHVSIALQSRLDKKELIHRLESVECCFDLMMEEFAKLKLFLSK